MGEFVTIKPKEGSRKFMSTGNMHIVHTKSDEKGNVVSEMKSDFIGQRFPKSKQLFRIPWHSTKRRWMLEGIEQNGELLNSYVRDTRLQYEKPHKLAGDYIKEADIFDYNDPFFNHRLAKIIANEGEYLIDKTNALENLLLRGIKMHPLFQLAGEDNPITAAGSRYIIVDKGIDSKIKKTSRNNKIKVMKLFDNLTSEKKLKIALAMGIINTEKTDFDVVDDLLFKAAEDDKTKIMDQKNMTRQDLFVLLCEMKSEDLNLKHRIAKAKSVGLLKRQANAGYLLFGSPVGKTLVEVEEYFKNSDPNNELLNRLEEALNDKSN